MLIDFYLDRILEVFRKMGFMRESIRDGTILATSVRMANVTKSRVFGSCDTPDSISEDSRDNHRAQSIAHHH